MAKRSMDAVGPSERQMHAHEAYASAMLLSMLYFLWGAVALPLVPPVFRRLDVAHLVAGSCGLVYFWSTRRRPRAWIAYAFSAAVIVHTLAVLPWTAIVWCRMARPFEATTVPQMAIVCMALMVPRSLVLGLVVMTLFAGEGAFVTLWAHHVGQAALVPIGEPVLTLYITIPAVALLWLRDRRRKLACRYIALHGEIAALGRLE